MDDIKTTGNEMYQAFMKSYFRYVEAVVANADNVYVVTPGNGDTPDERLYNALTSMPDKIAKDQKNALYSMVLRPDNVQVAATLRTAEGMEYLKVKVSGTMKGQFDGNLDNDKMLERIKEMDKRSERLENNARIEKQFQNINQVINDPKTDALSLKDYMVGLEVMFGGFQQNELKIASVENYSDSKAHASEWLSKVGQQVNRNIKSRDHLDRLAKTMESGVPNLLKELNNTNEQAKLMEIIHKCHDIPPYEYQALEAIRTRYEIVYERGAKEKADEDRNTLGVQGQRLLNEISEKRPNKNYTEMDLQAAGMAIELIEQTQPERVPNLLNQFSLKKGPNGYVACGDAALRHKVDGHALSDLVQTVSDADPLLMKSSSEFKAYKNAVQETQKQMASFRHSWDKGEAVSEKQIQQMLKSANRMDEKASEYTSYKLNALESRDPNATELKRLNAAAAGSAYADDIRRSVHAYTMEQSANLSNEELLDTFLLRAEASESMSEYVYLKSLQQNADKTPNLREALSYESMQKGKQLIEADPVFQKALENSKNRLFVEDQGQNIYGEYINGKLSEKKQKQQVQENVEHKQLQQEKQAVVNTAPQKGGM